MSSLKRSERKTVNEKHHMHNTLFSDNFLLAHTVCGKWLEGDKIMIVLQIIAVLIAALWIASTGPLLGYSLDYGVESLEDIFDPIIKYENGDFNLFGVIVLTVILNTIFMPMAIVFWFYKLCTVGRR